jgi:hypothetical protein
VQNEELHVMFLFNKYDKFKQKLFEEFEGKRQFGGYHLSET